VTGRVVDAATGATITGYSTRWVSTVLHRYNTEGPSGVRDRRHDNPGVAPVLTSQQQATLQAALLERPADGGVWTGPKVAAWIAQQTGRAVGPQCGWTYLKRFDCVLRRPRPRHLKADPEAQAAFKGGPGAGSSDYPGPASDGDGRPVGE
jgi:transposase